MYNGRKIYLGWKSFLWLLPGLRCEGFTGDGPAGGKPPPPPFSAGRYRLPRVGAGDSMFPSEPFMRRHRIAKIGPPTGFRVPGSSRAGWSVRSWPAASATPVQQLPPPRVPVEFHPGTRGDGCASFRVFLPLGFRRLCRPGFTLSCRGQMKRPVPGAPASPLEPSVRRFPQSFCGAWACGLYGTSWIDTLKVPRR